ncbi:MULTISPECIES: cytochrome c6 PetJ [Okeania]|uniref:Cytochrome C6 n=1 Tax=Okeania hirsuta TaxID=1458930 RepID=A0A3N6QYR8_9CYAN|nr:MULTISPECIES: c-type cytochrome [Okeania]NET14433.1 c-type cytochrome [Okeania sp. SIO1H6]NES76248.1 c-type cytochrome [Okeania sp. SIO1H4]NES93068.1 c-type cytochrome [Okeania sp. SIO2B9]NET19690.1 c-type cytochrome [Okeania sp. SIO1H5]NET74633.1 c-type cytochrome [Okeania sp. SIO1F9]
MKKIITVCLLIFTLINFIEIPPALAAETAKGAEIFQINCAGCHAGGGNIVRWWKNLKIRTLKRNKLDSVEAIAYLVKNGKNNMSAYKDRLTETEIETVSDYVLKQAENGWH